MYVQIWRKTFNSARPFRVTAGPERENENPEGGGGRGNREGLGSLVPTLSFNTRAWYKQKQGCCVRNSRAAVSRPLKWFRPGKETQDTNKAGSEEREC